MEIKAPKKIDISKYFPNGTGLLIECNYRNVKKVSFPMREYITTIVDESVFEDRTPLYVGLGFIAAVVIFLIAIL